MALVTNFIQDMPNVKVENHKEKSITDGQVSSLKRDFTRENSAFQLIMDNDEDRMRKLKTVKRIRGAILVIAVLCTIGLLCTMTALYLSERHRRVDLASANAKDLFLKQVNCFKQIGYSRSKPARALFEKIGSSLFTESYIYPDIKVLIYS